MESLFRSISIALLVVLGISFLMRLLKQPLIIGYIISGIIIGPFLFNLLPHKETLEIFSQFGIAFLLFIVGIHLNPKTIIIMKLLSDKDALDKLFGKISIGFLLVQDLIAIVILIIIPSFSNGG